MNLHFNLRIFQVLLVYIVLHSSTVPADISQPTCNDVSSFYHKHLATKTPYKYVANTNEVDFKYENCEPDKIWMVVRHGTRNPGVKFIRKVRGQLVDLRNEIVAKANLCPSDLRTLQLWLPEVEEEEEKILVHQGEDEMIELAERLQKRFPRLISEEYHNNSYLFKFTATQRTEESQKHFAIGLFGRKIANHVWRPEPLPRDPVLRFYKLCQRWRSEVDKNEASLLERLLFDGSSTVTVHRQHISSRLGLDRILSVDEIQLMYLTCAFESAWHPQNGPSIWCSMFTEEEMMALEYSEDLKYYWVDGYGFNITYRQACPIVKDMLQHLINHEDQRSIFYFTHSGTMLKTLAHLGMYKDESPLTHSNFNPQRLWKVSKIDAFGSNLAFVRFQCRDGVKVLTLHQERPMHLPGCPQDEELCPLDTMVSTYQDSLNECRFEEMCRTR